MANYKYDNKEYDFEAYKKQAISNFDNWVKNYNLSGSRAAKIKDAMYDLLSHMQSDSISKANLNSITFGGGYVGSKGLFGKKVKNSTHYKNAVAYLLNQFEQSSPYEAPKPEEKQKTKISKESLGQEYLQLLGDTSQLNPEYSKKAQLDALTKILNKYKWDIPDEYEFEGGTGEDFKNIITNAISAIGNDNGLDDDNYAYYQLGITNPFYVKPKEETETKGSTDINNLLSQAIRDGQITEDFARQILPYFSTQQPTVTEPEAPAVKAPETTTATETPSEKEQKIDWDSLITTIKANVDNYGKDNQDWVNVATQLGNSLKELQPQEYPIGLEKKNDIFVIAVGKKKMVGWDPNKKQVILGNVKQKKRPGATPSFPSNKKGGYLKLLKQNSYE